MAAASEEDVTECPSRNCTAGLIAKADIAPLHAAMSVERKDAEAVPGSLRAAVKRA